MRSAKLRHVGASIEDVDDRPSRTLDKALFQQLATAQWFAERRSLLISGPSGSVRPARLHPRPESLQGQLHIVYRRLPRLFAELELAHGDDRLPRLFRSLVKAVLLILDGWGPDG